MPYPTLAYAKTAAAAGTFTIQVRDAHDTLPQASESAYEWRGNRVELIHDDGTPSVVSPDRSGTVTVSVGRSGKGTLTNVTRTGTSRSPVIYRMLRGGGVEVSAGTPHTVEISARLRMSLWTMGAPFAARLNGANVELDTELLDLLKDARVDDLSLVYTIGWDTRATGATKARPPKWHDGFAPLGSAAHREAYLRKLIDELHKRNVQVIAGFPLVNASLKAGQEVSGKEKGYQERAQDFANWLKAPEPGDIEAYAGAINHFFESRGLDVDGIGFDIEIDQVKGEHRDNLARLYRATSEAMAHRNGLVSYANAPFLVDGDGTSAMRAQPFATAATGLNLLARPMCYDAVKSSLPSDIAKSIACALRPSAQNRGGGLHPSQVQFAIWTKKLTIPVEKLCIDVLRPNRIGLMLYTLPVDRNAVKAFLTDCRTWNKALNPCEGPNGQEGQLLQVPRGFGGWPAPRRKP